MLKRYTCNGFYLGQKVKFKNEERIIIAVDEGGTGFALKGGTMKEFPIKDFPCATYVAMEYENEYCWEWVRIDELDFHKENVLLIKTTRINEEYSAVEIIYQNEDVLKRCRFSDEEIGVESSFQPDYSAGTNILYIKGWNDSKDNVPFIAENQYVEIIEEKVRLINEKYGKSRRWRASEGDTYYYIDEFMEEVSEDIEEFNQFNDYLYSSCNYFKTKDKAEEKLEKIKKIMKGDE